jgi:hypothetical protein
LVARRETGTQGRVFTAYVAAARKLEPRLGPPSPPDPPSGLRPIVPVPVVPLYHCAPDRGDTARIMAKRQGFTRIVELLTKSGARE